MPGPVFSRFANWFNVAPWLPPKMVSSPVAQAMITTLIVSTFVPSDSSWSETIKGLARPTGVGPVIDLTVNRYKTYLYISWCRSLFYSQWEFSISYLILFNRKTTENKSWQHDSNAFFRLHVEYWVASSVAESDVLTKIVTIRNALTIATRVFLFMVRLQGAV